MNPFTDAEDRQAVLCLGAAAILLGMVVSGRLAPQAVDADAMMDSAFAFAERFLVKVEQRVANVKGKP